MAWLHGDHTQHAGARHRHFRMVCCQRRGWINDAPSVVPMARAALAVHRPVCHSIMCTCRASAVAMCRANQPWWCCQQLGLVLARKAHGGNALHASVSGTVWKISAAYTLVRHHAPCWVLSQPCLTLVGCGQGFLCLSSTMVYVTVSLSETLRATEPLFTVVLAWAIMRDAPSMSVVVALVPTVTGVALAAMGGTGFSGMGLAMAMFSNAAFSMRSVWTKVLRRCVHCCFCVVALVPCL